MKLKLLILWLVLLAGVSSLRAAEAYTYLDTTDNCLYFCYDDLKSSRNFTTYSFYTYSDGEPMWTNIVGQVKTVYFTKGFANYTPTTCCKWFQGMQNLTNVAYIARLNTSKVTNMAYMFYDCRSLTSLNLSSFNTANVTNMAYMFYDCRSLTSLNVSSFNTANVTDMHCMFDDCKSLTSLNVSNFNTAKVTDMSWMFCYCNRLTSLNVSNFNTANVTDMEGMFSYCHSLTSLNVSSFNTAKAEYMNIMFCDCYNLTSLNVSNFNTAKVTAMWRMFRNCRSLTSLDLSNFNTAECTNMEYMFKGCSSLTYLNVSSFNTAKAEYMTFMFCDCSSLTSIDVTHFITSTNVTKNISDMFAGCSKLTSLTLNFPPITNAFRVLKGCTGLKSLTLTDTSYGYDAFEGVGTSYSPCKLSYNKTSHPTFTRITPNYVVWQKGYFQNENMRAFATLNSSGELRFQYSDMFWEYQNNPAYTIYEMNTGTNLPGWYAKRNNVKSAVFEESFTNARPTSCYSWFYYMEHLQSITDLRYLQTENVTNMSRMFSHCNALKSIDVSSFRTGLVTDMHGMFESNPNLESLGETIFYTYDVTDMGAMFANCPKLESLGVKLVSTTNVTDMSGMFSGCTNLKSLELYRLNTAKVTNMSSMFSNCKSLTSLDVSKFNTANVTNFSNMFDGCTGLTALDLSKFDFSKVTTSAGSSAMMRNCSALKKLAIPSTADRLGAAACTGVGTTTAPCTLVHPLGLALEKTVEGDGWYKWKDGYFKDVELEPYAVLSTDKKTLAFYYDIYYGSRPGTVYDLNTGDNAPGWSVLDNNPVTGVVFDSSFADARPTSCRSWFSGMVNLASIAGIEHLNTSNVTDMSEMFSGCSSLESLDLGNFTFGSDARTEKFLYNNLALQTLTIPATAVCWDAGACTGVGTQSAPCILVYPDGFTPEVTEAGGSWYVWKSGYFKDAGPKPYAVLNGNVLTLYYDQNRFSRPGTSYGLNTGVENPGWYDKRASITKVVVNVNFAGARPTTCYRWFAGTKTKTVTNFRYINTSQVTNMAYMFSGCTSLESLDLAKINTAGVNTMEQMFNGCTKLATLDLSKFNTSNVTNVSRMFDGCTGLTALNLSKFDFSKVSTAANSSAMMRNCSALQELTIPSTANKLGSFVCTGIGTKTAPCTLVYPEGFHVVKSETGDGWYVWKSGYFKDKVLFPQGDVNHDGYVTVVDASLTVDYVMGNNPPVFFIENADMNSDGSVSITDVSKIVDMVMNGSSTHAPAL